MAGMTKLENRTSQLGREKNGNGNHSLRDSATSIAPTAREGIGSSNNVLIEKLRAPDLGRDESASENADEETQCNQAPRVGDEASHGSWN
jgi:hypothetical protein